MISNVSCEILIDRKKRSKGKYFETGYTIYSGIKMNDYRLEPLLYFPSVHNVDLHDLFDKYRAAAYDEVQSNDFTDQQLLSLSNIIPLKRNEQLEFLSVEQSHSLYSSVSTSVLDFIPSLPSTIIHELRPIFQTFVSDQKCLSFASDICSTAKKYDDPVLQSISLSFNTLSHEITPMSIPKMSEMRVQCSFIHPLLLGITKTMPSTLPHCSNKLAFDDNHYIMHCRPDYRVDLYTESGMYDGTNLFGELKPADADPSDVKRDYHKCMCLGKLALQSFNYPYVLNFYSVHTTIHFYLYHSLNSHLTFALHLDTITIPSTFDTFETYLTLLSILYRLSHIFHTLCIPKNQNLQKPISPTVPYSATKHAIKKKKN
ncbi:hypothetical protein BD560DRAFT_493389 [Blakeslea trispora]|nr:hypothetical protein BD560DRAFT_493389 [Blakeslea trispora]